MSADTMVMAYMFHTSCFMHNMTLLPSMLFYSNAREMYDLLAQLECTLDYVLRILVDQLAIIIWKERYKNIVSKLTMLGMLFSWMDICFKTRMFHSIPMQCNLRKCGSGKPVKHYIHHHNIGHWTMLTYFIYVNYNIK